MAAREGLLVRFEAERSPARGVRARFVKAASRRPHL